MTTEQHRSRRSDPVAAARYRRPSNALWRDTGQHVVVLPLGERTDVKVLGGGSALLWRVLDEPRSVDEVADVLGQAGVPTPPHHELVACLEDLQTQLLIEASDR